MKLEDLTQNTNGDQSKFPKFRAIGDTVQGDFVSFEEGVKGKYGLEDQLVVENDNGSMMISCPAHLSRVVKSNIEKGNIKEGATLTIKFANEKDIGKASKMKVFEVDVEEQPPF